MSEVAEKEGASNAAPRDRNAPPLSELEILRRLCDRLAFTMEAKTWKPIVATGTTVTAMRFVAHEIRVLAECISDVADGSEELRESFYMLSLRCEAMGELAQLMADGVVALDESDLPRAT